jgi:hypothetical protein
MSVEGIILHHGEAHGVTLHLADWGLPPFSLV